MAISVEQAVEQILKNTPVLEEEPASLWESVGRVLARDITAAGIQPPFDRSPLDGYAVIAADLRDASPENPAVLRVVDTLYAGQLSRVPVCRGQAVRLTTGSMIPKGADCIIRQEDTDLGESTVRIRTPGKANGNYCHRGEEYKPGDVLISAGESVNAAVIAVAAGAGLPRLPVLRRPRAAILSTGDEIVQPGQPLPPGKIYDANAAYLAARLRQLGVQVTAMGHVGDDLESISAALERCGPRTDLILTTGGVSVGQKDLLEAAAGHFGARIVFHGISMKPGMPTLFAVKGTRLLLGLSGNPFSAAVAFELLVPPMLAKMTRDTALHLRRERVRTGNSFGKHSPCRRFLRAFCQNGIVWMPEEQSNGQMRSMIGCNCLVDVPAKTGAIDAGETVDIVWISKADGSGCEAR